MSIELPPSLAWVATLAVGQSWPKGDEDKLRELGTAWDEAAREIVGITAELGPAAAQVLQNLGGSVADEFTTFTEQLRSNLPAVATSANQLATLARNTGVQIEYAKYMILAQLVWLAVEIAQWIYFAPEIIPSLIAAARLAVREILRRLLISVAVGIGVMMGMDAAVQAIQILKGDRTHWSTENTLSALQSGAISGAIGGAIFTAGAAVAPKFASSLPGMLALGGLTGEISNLAFGGMEGAGASIAAGALGALGGGGRRRSGGGDKTEVGPVPDLHTPDVPDLHMPDPGIVNRLTDATAPVEPPGTGGAHLPGAAGHGAAGHGAGGRPGTESSGTAAAGEPTGTTGTSGPAAVSGHGPRTSNGGTPAPPGAGTSSGGTAVQHGAGTSNGGTAVRHGPVGAAGPSRAASPAHEATGLPGFETTITGPGAQHAHAPEGVAGPGGTTASAGQGPAAQGSGARMEHPAAGTQSSGPAGNTSAPAGNASGSGRGRSSGEATAAPAGTGREFPSVPTSSPGRSAGEVAGAPARSGRDFPSVPTSSPGRSSSADGALPARSGLAEGGRPVTSAEPASHESAASTAPHGAGLPASDHVPVDPGTGRPAEARTEPVPVSGDGGIERFAQLENLRAPTDLLSTAPAAPATPVVSPRAAVEQRAQGLDQVAREAGMSTADRRAQRQAINEAARAHDWSEATRRLEEFRHLVGARVLNQRLEAFQNHVQGGFDRLGELGASHDTWREKVDAVEAARRTGDPALLDSALREYTAYVEQHVPAEALTGKDAARPYDAGLEQIRRELAATRDPRELARLRGRLEDRLDTVALQDRLEHLTSDDLSPEETALRQRIVNASGPEDAAHALRQLDNHREERALRERLDRLAGDGPPPDDRSGDGEERLRERAGELVQASGDPREQELWQRVHEAPTPEQAEQAWYELHDHREERALQERLDRLAGDGPPPDDRSGDGEDRPGDGEERLRERMGELVQVSGDPREYELWQRIHEAPTAAEAERAHRDLEAHVRQREEGREQRVRDYRREIEALHEKRTEQLLTGSSEDAALTGERLAEIQQRLDDSLTYGERVRGLREELAQGVDRPGDKRRLDRIIGKGIAARQQESRSRDGDGGPRTPEEVERLLDGLPDTRNRPLPDSGSSPDPGTVASRPGAADDLTSSGDVRTGDRPDDPAVDAGPPPEPRTERGNASSGREKTEGRAAEPGVEQLQLQAERERPPSGEESHGDEPLLSSWIPQAGDLDTVRAMAREQDGRGEEQAQSLLDDGAPAITGDHQSADRGDVRPGAGGPRDSGTGSLAVPGRADGLHRQDLAFAEGSAKVSAERLREIDALAADTARAAVTNARAGRPLPTVTITGYGNGTRSGEVHFGHALQSGQRRADAVAAAFTNSLGEHLESLQSGALHPIAPDALTITTRSHGHELPPEATPADDTAEARRRATIVVDDHRQPAALDDLPATTEDQRLQPHGQVASEARIHSPAGVEETLDHGVSRDRDGRSGPVDDSPLGPVAPEPLRHPVGSFAGDPAPLSRFALGGGEGEPVEVPRELNFVWLGGALQAPARANLLAWVERAGAAGWRVRIWTNEGAAAANAGFFGAHFAGGQAEMRLVTPRLFDDRPAALFGAGRQKRVYDIAISRRAFAMASDMVRYAVLRQYGGVYADVDLAPGRVELPREPLRIPRGEDAVPFLGPLIRDQRSIDSARKYFELRDEHFTGDELVERAARLNYAYGRFGNQFIVAPPGSAFLERLYQRIPERVRAAMRQPYFDPKRDAATYTGPLLWERELTRVRIDPTMRERVARLLGSGRKDRYPLSRPRVDPAMLEQWAPLGWVTPESSNQETATPQITQRPEGVGNWAESTARALEEAYWWELLAHAPVERREHVWADPASTRPVRSAFDVRRVERGGDRLTELTVALDLRPGQGVSPEQLAGVRRRLATGVHDLLNAPGHRLPGGDLLQVKVIPADQDHPAHLTVDVLAETDAMTQHTWMIAQRPELYVHELAHQLGLRDEYGRASRSVGGPTGEIARTADVPGSLLGNFDASLPAEGLLQGGLRGRHLALLAALIGDIEPYTGRGDAATGGARTGPTTRPGASRPEAEAAEPEASSRSHGAAGLPGFETTIVGPGAQHTRAPEGAGESSRTAAVPAGQGSAMAEPRMGPESVTADSAHQEAAAPQILWQPERVDDWAGDADRALEDAYRRADAVVEPSGTPSEARGATVDSGEGVHASAPRPEQGSHDGGTGDVSNEPVRDAGAVHALNDASIESKTASWRDFVDARGMRYADRFSTEEAFNWRTKDLDLGRDVEAAQARFKGDAGTSGPVPKVVPDVVPEVVSAEELPPGAVEQRLPSTSRDAYVVHGQTLPDGRVVVDGEAMTAERLAAWIGDQRAFGKSAEGRPVVLVAADAETFAPVVAARLDRPVVAPWGGFVQVPSGRLMTGTAVRMQDGGLSLAGTPADTWKVYEPGGEVTPLARELGAALDLLAGRGGGLTAPAEVPAQVTMWGAGQGRPVSELGDLAQDPALQWLSIIAGAPADTPAQESSEPGLDQTAASAQPSPVGTADTKADADLTATVSPPGSTQPAEVQAESAPAGGPAEGARPAETPEPEPEAASSGPETVRPRRPVYPVAEIDQRRPVGLEQAAPALAERTVWEDDARLPSYFFDEADPGPGHGDTRLRGHAEILAGLQSLSLPQVTWDEIRDALAEEPASFLGDGRPFTVGSPGQEPYEIVIQARSRGNWDRFHDMHPESIRVDTLTAQTSGVTTEKTSGTQSHLSFALPLGPGGTRGTGFGQVNLDMVGNERAYTYGYGTVGTDQREVRVSGGSHVHVDDLTFSVRTYRTDIGVQRQMSALAQFVVQGGLEVRVPDRLTKPADTDLPRRFALNGRVPDTYHVEQVGSVAPLMDRALELFPGSAIGSPAYQALRQMLSTRGVTSAMGEMIQDWSGLQEVAGTDLERPVGALRLRARPISAELLVAADGHEMRVGRVGGTRTEVTAATTNALQVSAMAGGMGSFHGAVARGRIQAGLTGQVAWSTRESAMSGGTATRKRLAVTSGTTGLYKVEVEYGMQRTGGEEVTARGHVLLRLPESEARRLAAGQSPDQAAQPAVPPYLTADRPSTLGLHDVRSLTGLPSLQERAIAALARRYPNLVAPWIELDPAHPRWKGNQDVYILALRNTIELSRFLSATSIAPSMDTLISTGLRLRLRAYDLFRKDYVTVRLRAELRNRRFAGSESDIGMRVYSTLADRLDSARRVQYSASAGIGMGGRAQDAAAVYTGSVSASWRYTWQRSRTSTFGQALTGDDQVVAPGPSHSFAYDLDFRLEAAGFNRLRNAVRAGTLEVLAHEYFVRKTPWAPVLDDGPATGTLTVRVPDSLTKAMAEPVPAPARTDAGAGQGADTRDWRQRGHAVVGVTGTAELNKAVQGVIAESQEDSWLFTQPGSTAHEVVQDGLTADAHNANFLRMATGGWGLGPVLAKRPVQDRIGTVKVTAEVGRLRAVSGLISGMELELDRQGEMRSGHGVGTAQGHGAGLSATFGAKPTIDGTPVIGGYGALWTLYERMRGQERSSSLTGVHDVDPVPSGRFVLVTGDVTYTVAAQGRRTGRAAPKFAVATRDPSTELTVPEGVYMLVPEDDARDMGLLPQAPGAEPDYGSVTVPREYLSAPLGWAPENTPDAGEAVALLRTWFEDKASGRLPSRYAGLLPAEELEDLSNNLRHLRSATSTLGMAGLLSQMVADGVPIRLLQGRAYLPWTNSARVWIRVQLGDPTFLRAHHNMEIDEYPSNAEAEQTSQSISRTRGGGISITQTPLLHDSPAHHVDAAFTDVGTLTQTDTRTEAKRSTHLRGTVASPRATAKLAFPTTVILSVEEKGKVVHSVSAPGGPLVAQVPWGFTVPTARAGAEMGASLRSLQPGVGAHDRPLELPDAAAILNVGGVAAIRHVGTAAVAAVHGVPDHRVGRTPLTQGGNVAGEVLANALSQPVLRTFFPRLTRLGGLELPELSENFITGGATAQSTAHAQVDLRGGVLTSVSYDHRMDTADRQAQSVAAKGTRSDGRSATVGAGPIFATTGPDLEAGPAYQGGLNSTQRMWVEGDADGDGTQVDQAQRSLRKDLSTRSFVFRFPVDWRITATGTRATWSGLGAALARKGPLRPQTKELHVEKGVWIRLTEAEARANGLITDENFPPVVSAEWDAVAAASVAWKAADKTFRDTRDDVRTAHDAVEAARKNVAEAEAALAEHPDDVAALAAATGAQAALADAEPETAAPEEAMAAVRTAAEKAAARFRDLHASAVAMTTWHRTPAAQRAGKKPRPLPSQEQVAQDRAAREQAAEFERWVPLPPLPTIAEEDESGGLGGSSDEGDALRDLRADAPSPEGFQVGPSQGIHPDGLTADDIAQGLYENLPIDEVHELARTAAWILRSQSDSPLGESIRAVDERGQLWRIADELHRNGRQAAELLARALTALRENRSVAAPDESVDLGTVSARRPPKVEQAPEDPPEPQSGEGEPQVSTAPRSDERPPADGPTYSTVSETARVDPDHDFGPPVAPQRARATEMDGRNVRLNPLWVPLEEMSPSLLTGDRNSVWLYTVTEDLRVLLGSEQPSAIMSEGQLTDLVAGLREKDPQLREMDLGQARRSVIQWLDGQGHLGIAARFAADGRTGPGPSRVSGEFRWNEASRSWMVDDNSGRYMSEEVRGGLDSVDAARWVGNVAKRFSEHLGMEVRPELFNIAFVRPIRDSSGRVVGHSFLDDEWHGVVESAAHLLLSGAVTHVRSDSEPEAVYPLREDPVGFFPKPWGDTPAHVIVVVGDRSGVAVRISADEEFAMDGERFVRLLLNRQEGFRQLPPDVPILMLGGEMAADPDPDEWSVKPPAGQVIANRTGRDIWASTTFLFPIRDESARTHSALALREQGGRRGELVRFRSDPGPDELHRLVAATASHPGQAGTVPGGDARRMLHLVRTARRLYPGDDAEQHLKALRALDDLRSADKTLGVLPALPFDVNVLDQIARVVYGWPGSTGVSSDGRRHLISLVETMAGTSGGSVTVKDLARAARAMRTPPRIGTFVDAPRKPEADSIVVVGNDDSVSTSSSSSGSSSEVSASSAALRAIFPGALVFGRERAAAGYGLLQWGQYVGGLPHDQQVSLRNHMQGPMSAPGLPYRPSFLEINAYLRQRWEATMAGLWDLDLLGFVTFRNNDDKTATVRVSRFLEQAREAVQHDIRNIDAAIGSRPVREDLVVSTTTVLHLLGSSPEEWLGTVFRARGYLSTSLGEPARSGTPSVLYLRVPRGTRALGLAMLMPSGTGDRELLIDRDTVIRIIDVTRSQDGKWRVYGEILTPDDQIPVDVVDI